MTNTPAPRKPTVIQPSKVQVPVVHTPTRISGSALKPTSSQTIVPTAIKSLEQKPFSPVVPTNVLGVVTCTLSLDDIIKSYKLKQDDAKFIFKKLQSIDVEHLTVHNVQTLMVDEVRHFSNFRDSLFSYATQDTSEANFVSSFLKLRASVQKLQGKSTIGFLNIITSNRSSIVSLKKELDVFVAHQTAFLSFLTDFRAKEIDVELSAHRLKLWTYVFSTLSTKDGIKEICNSASASISSLVSAYYNEKNIVMPDLTYLNIIEADLPSKLNIWISTLQEKYKHQHAYEDLQKVFALHP